MKKLAPGFLIAMPQMVDANFRQAVILLIEHNDEGTLGLVLNRPSPLTLLELATSQSMEVAPSRKGSPVYVGGPVDPHRGFVLHDSHEIDESHVLSGELQLSVTTDALRSILADDHSRMRFCLGYAGWDSNQLEQEFRRGSWLFADVDADLVLDCPSELMWERSIRNMGVEPGMLVPVGGIQ